MKRTVELAVGDNGFAWYWPATASQFRKGEYACDVSALTWQNCLALADAFQSYSDELRLLEAMDAGELP